MAVIITNSFFNYKFECLINLKKNSILQSLSIYVLQLKVFELSSAWVIVSC